MREKVSQTIRLARVVWTEILQAYVILGSTAGALIGLTIGAFSGEPAALHWMPLLALRGALVGLLLGTTVGAIVGVMLGGCAGGIVIVGLAVDSVTVKCVPRTSASAGAPAEVAPAGAPEGRGDEASPSDALSAQ